MSLRLLSLPARCCVLSRRLLRPVAVLALAAVLPLLGGCGGGKESAAGSAQAAAVAPLPAQTWFPLKVGDKVVELQLALNDAERSRGLMGRKSLEADQGMLFVFDRGTRQSFWMHNTPLPLDIGYFDNDGVLREIYALYPFDRTSVSSRRSDIRYALEMNQGWFSRNDVKPGAQLDMQALAAAVDQRLGRQ